MSCLEGAKPPIQHFLDECTNVRLKTMVKAGAKRPCVMLAWGKWFSDNFGG